MSETQNNQPEQLTLTQKLERLVTTSYDNIKKLKAFNLDDRMGSLDPRILREMLVDVAKASTYISSLSSDFAPFATTIKRQFLLKEEVYMSELASAMVDLSPEEKKVSKDERQAIAAKRIQPQFREDYVTYRDLTVISDDYVRFLKARMDELKVIQKNISEQLSTLRIDRSINGAVDVPNNGKWG